MNEVYEYKEFEEWATKHHKGINLTREGKGYRYALAEQWFEAWQARAALAATPAAGFDVRKSDNNAAASVVLPEQDATLLNQGVELLHALSNDERNRGNCSAAEGATASAHAVQRLAALLATGGQAQAHAVEQEPFGYFKAEPFGWTDCGPDDEGAVALYEKPQAMLDTGGQAQADARDAGLGTARAFIEWVKAQPEDREQTTIDGALVEFEAHIAAIAAAKGE